jgi:acetyl esterase/lipase
MQSVSYRTDDVDPRNSLSRLHLPAFWAFGGEDNLVPVELSVNRLDRLIAEGHSFQYRVYPENGHELVVFDFSRFSLSPAFEEAVSWIRETAHR